MRTANPTLNSKTFSNMAQSTTGEVMTINGTVNKSAFLLLLLVFSASFTWKTFFNAMTTGGSFEVAIENALPVIYPWAIGGMIGGLLFALITIFKQEWAPYTAPIYVLLEGLFLGAISAFMEAVFPGIVLQAVGLTFGTLFALLMAYKSGLIRATENFKLGVVAATGGIALIYLVSFILSFFGTTIPYIHESGWLGIGFSLFVVVIAALNLVLDFDFIEEGAESGAPKYMEWYAAFGLMVTLIWLYVEFLRLLAKLRSE